MQAPPFRIVWLSGQLLKGPEKGLSPCTGFCGKRKPLLKEDFVSRSISWSNEGGIPSSSVRGIKTGSLVTECRRVAVCFVGCCVWK